MASIFSLKSTDKVMLVDRITPANSAMPEAHLVSLSIGKIARCSPNRTESTIRLLD